MKHALNWAVLTLVLALLGSCGLMREPKGAAPVSATPAVAAVSADEVARAMEEDRLFSDYRWKTLQVQGTVAAVSQEDSGLVLELKTSEPMKVLCDLGKQAVRYQVGDAITIESADPQREAAAVMLRNCRVP